MKTVDLDPKKNYIFGFHPHGETRTRLSLLHRSWTLGTSPKASQLHLVGRGTELLCWGSRKRAEPSGKPLSRLPLPVCLSGVLVAGAFGNFCTEATGFSRQFPGLRSHLLMLPFWFRVPIFRDYIMSGGTPPCPLTSAAFCLTDPALGRRLPAHYPLVASAWSHDSSRFSLA